MKKIPLTRGMFALVSDRDYARLNKFKWHIMGKPGLLYAYAQTKTCEGKKHFSMHRYILNPRDHELVDHADGNTLNNQRRNIRICSKSQNVCNGKTRKDNVSGYRGVRLNTRFNGYDARIGVKGSSYIGFFYSPIDAAIAYDRRAKKMYGKFARLNFPKGDKP